MSSIASQQIVLLTEDDALIAMDLSDALERAGYRPLDPVGTGAGALAHLERETPVLAIIDIMLKDGPCTELVRELRRRGIPFLVHSACRRNEPLAAEFQDAPWVNKPANPSDVVDLCNELSRARTASEPDPDAAPAVASPLTRKLERFVALSGTDRRILERIGADAAPVPRRTDLVREGAAPEGVFLVTEGIVCRHKVQADGRRQVMAYLLPGDLCDLDVTLLDRMDHTLTTVTACRVAHIAPDAIAEIMERHPQVARGLRTATLVDEATLREWLVNVGCRTALERLAHLFCELILRLRAVGLAGEATPVLPLTQGDLADTTGLTNVQVNRTLGDMRRQGLIASEGGFPAILDLPRLRTIAAFRPNYLHLENRAA